MYIERNYCINVLSGRMHRSIPNAKVVYVRHKYTSLVLGGSLVHKCQSHNVVNNQYPFEISLTLLELALNWELFHSGYLMVHIGLVRLELHCFEFFTVASVMTGDLFSHSF